MEVPKQPLVFQGVQPDVPPIADIWAVLNIRTTMIANLLLDTVQLPETCRLNRYLRREDVSSLGTVRYNDIGLVIEVVVLDNNGPVNLAFSSVKKIILGRPGSLVKIRDAVFVTDGSDGKIKYVTVDGDLDAVGEWRLQAQVEVPAVGTFRTEVGTFFVEPAIDVGVRDP